jgi:hypothetical protein
VVSARHSQGALAMAIDRGGNEKARLLESKGNGILRRHCGVARLGRFAHVFGTGDVAEEKRRSAPSGATPWS